jgi:hypothetical protein
MAGRFRGAVGMTSTPSGDLSAATAFTEATFLAAVFFAAVFFAGVVTFSAFVLVVVSWSCCVGMI